MESEENFKKQLIESLNLINLNWIDGDKMGGSEKKADIINHSLKVVIEVKDDTNYKLELATEPGVMIGQSIDVKKMNQRFADHVKSANNKFKEYSHYKTIFILRSEFPLEKLIRYAIDGCHSYLVPGKIYIGRKGKYSKYIKREIGCFLIFINKQRYYFPNDLAKKDRVVSKKEVEKIFGYTFNDVPES
jgi:hypothetical protein